MKIGYPCINLTLPCKSDRTFRLKSYSEERLIETARNNLDCLQRILEFNLEHDLFFFRITSDLIPFASHPVCKFNWQEYFSKKFREIGLFIRKNGMRISMHPDQFTIINSRDAGVFERSSKELLYHAQVMDLLELDRSHKIQIHAGGVYGDKEESIKRFVRRFKILAPAVRKRLVVENDDVSYTLADCLLISKAAGIPVLFDVFHHRMNSSGESLGEAFSLFTGTWKRTDGLPMVDYSSGQRGAARRKHAQTIDLADFKRFIKDTRKYDFDIMLEIKDKERSALKAIKAVARL